MQRNILEKDSTWVMISVEFFLKAGHRGAPWWVVVLMSHFLICFILNKSFVKYSSIQCLILLYECLKVNGLCWQRPTTCRLRLMHLVLLSFKVMYTFTGILFITNDGELRNNLRTFAYKIERRRKLERPHCSEDHWKRLKYLTMRAHTITYTVDSLKSLLDLYICNQRLNINKLW